MNDLMTKVAEVDPDFARSLRRNQILSYVFAAVALTAIVGTAYAVVVNFGQDNDITQIQHSACQAEPAGDACQIAKRQSSKAADLYTTCIPFWKAGYRCPKPGSAAAERRADELQANSKSIQNLDNGSGGEATDAPPDPDAPSVPDQLGVGKGQGGGKGDSGSPTTQPQPGGPANSPAPTGSATTTTSSPHAVVVDPGSNQSDNDNQGDGPTSVLESASTTVGEVVNGAGHVVESTTCGLVKPLLCLKP